MIDRFPVFVTAAGLLCPAVLAFHADDPAGLAGVLAAGHVVPALAALVFAATGAASLAGATRAGALVGAFGSLLALALVIIAGFLPALATAIGLAAGEIARPLGPGAAVMAGALVALFAGSIARFGAFRNDRFVSVSVITIGALVVLFVFWPVVRMLSEAFYGESDVAARVFIDRLLQGDIWSLACLWSTARCGVAPNTVILGILAAFFSTSLALGLALIAVRTNVRFPRAFDALAILPIITPPFVIGLALIVLFGRTGIITTAMWDLFGIPRSRWLYGLPGVLLAQVLSQVPLSFLILVGALKALSPTLEEAAQTLRATRTRILMTVTLPLLLPAIANTYLLAFVESLADFGNPLVLGGNFEVLSTKIFFAVVGAQHEPGRAAVLAMVLLAFTLAAFVLQMRLLGKTSFVTVSGKGDSGVPTELPKGLPAGLWGIIVPWIALTVAVYTIVLIGGFVKDIGRFDMTPTLDHLRTGFLVEWTDNGLFWAGSAWDSFWTTVLVSAAAAPLTTIIGLLTAYVLARQHFRGRRSLEFLTMLSFAIPGTVIGVAYILAFNVPPVEITGTGFILIACFVFRNMPVGVRAGIAALSQIDPSLDEASATLRASTGRTLVAVVLPLMKPAIVATLVFSFVHAMTAVSAIIFLVTARYNMATAYIVGRVEAGEYSLAIAYCAFMIVFMIAAIATIRLVVGEARLGRRGSGEIVSGGN
ncbi:iron ABC transporter permease [Stappia sp. MMSF_3263]|uniref:ABC transporter permease n=1 Tax=Stappia sp. MMSF_3263 TaxID=3046693 RepID=UPI00273DE262|nr:iron ABC transporter permease [Stappia sp. MMSF_3263]